MSYWSWVNWKFLPNVAFSQNLMKDFFLQVFSQWSPDVHSNHFNVEATSVQSTRTLRFLKTIITPSCWYSLDSSRWVRYSQMSAHLPGFQSFLRFLHHFVMTKLATSSIRFNEVFSRGNTYLLLDQTYKPQINLFIRHKFIWKYFLLEIVYFFRQHKNESTIHMKSLYFSMSTKQW